jgi:hypothetical protein
MVNMVTLDEIIEDLEEMIANPTEADYENQGYWMALESLKYLKEYRDVKEDLVDRIWVLRQLWKL